MKSKNVAGHGNHDSAGRAWTVSIAVPGSIIDNTQNLEFATFVAGQIARTAAIFNVDEVVVIDEDHTDDESISAGSAFLARVLQYQETPQYLRKALVPFHKDLRLAGLLPPVDAPHHMRVMEWKPWREGVVLRSDPRTGSFVDVGLYDTEAHVPQALQPGMRVTLAVGAEPNTQTGDSGADVLQAEVALPDEPRTAAGLYWGYTTRIARGVGAVFSECPYEGGYDLTIGTSEHGSVESAAQLQLPRFQHLLVAFGGPKGLEDAFQRDPAVSVTRPLDPNDAFHMYINTCPNQGSRTIRTEEAVLISMSYLQPAVQAAAGRT